MLMRVPFITCKGPRRGSSGIRVLAGMRAHFCNIGVDGANRSRIGPGWPPCSRRGGLRLTAGRTVAVAPRGASRVATALAMLALGACATYAPAPIEPAKTAEAFGARRLDAPALRDEVARVLPAAAQAWPPAEWDRASLLAVALADNGALAVARAEVEAALAARITAGERPNPVIGLQAEYARHEPDRWLYGISFDFLLPHRAVRTIELESAELGAAGARADLMEKTWSVRRALVAALSDREGARRRLDVATRLADAQDRLITLQQRRVDAGEDAPGDLNVSQAARLDIEQQVANARADLVAA